MAKEIRTTAWRTADNDWRADLTAKVFADARKKARVLLQNKWPVLRPKNRPNAVLPILAYCRD